MKFSLKEQILATHACLKHQKPVFILRFTQCVFHHFLIYKITIIQYSHHKIVLHVKNRHLFEEQKKFC